MLPSRQDIVSLLKNPNTTLFMQVYTQVIDDHQENLQEMINLYLEARKYAIFLRGDADRILRGIFSPIIRIELTLPERIAAENDKTSIYRHIQMLCIILLRRNSLFMKLSSETIATIVVHSVKFPNEKVRDIMLSEKHHILLTKAISNVTSAVRTRSLDSAQR